MKQLTSVIAILILLSSCTKTLEISEDTQRHLVAQCLFCPDSLWAVHLSETSLIGESYHFQIEDTTKSIRDANVLIKDIDGNLVDELSYDQKGWYRSKTYKPEIDKEYVIEVSSKKFPKLITASNYVPNAINYSYKVNVTSNKISVDTMEIDLGDNFDIELTLHDEIEEDNYYIIFLIQTIGSSTGKDYRRKLYLSTEDIFIDRNYEDDLFDENTTFSGRQIFIRDEHFNGKSYTLKFHSQGFPNTIKAELFVANCTKECFRYLFSSFYGIPDYMEPLIVAPRNVYSNFSDNLGIFAGYNQKKVTLVNNKNLNNN